MTAITVSSVRPVALAAGTIAVIANTRATKKTGAIAEANKLRAIVVNEFDVSSLPSKWTMFAANQLHKVATQQLAALWETNGNAWTETDSALWTTDALLAFASRESESKRLTADNITEQAAAFVATYDEAKRAPAMKVLVSMAAPAKQGTEKQCFALAEKLTLWIEADAMERDEDANPVLLIVARKLAERAAEMKVQREAYDAEQTEAF